MTAALYTTVPQNISQSQTEFSLLVQFEHYLGCWFHLKQELKKHIGAEQAFMPKDAAQITNIPVYLQIQLVDFAKQQRAQVSKIASNQQQIFYEQALYATISMIDEQLLQQMEWSQSEDWLKLMLEKALFGTRNAGSKLIERMEKLVDTEQTPSELERQLAAVYLRVLRLGFDGKYHHTQSKLDILVLKLVNLSALKITNLDQPYLFQQAYAHNKSPEHKSRLAPIKFWRRFLIIFLIGYHLVTWVAVYMVTADLNQELLQQQVLPASTQVRESSIDS
ncbi:MAG: type IV/VI secretion system ImpK/VasF family protein [Paraglaciecola sp.]|jgi:type IV/VI secretion system ImpK/VasF family protein